jgi:ribose transport system permease protein
MGSSMPDVTQLQADTDPVGPGGPKVRFPFASVARGRHRWIVVAIRDQMPLVLLVALLLVGGVLSDVFLTPRNILNILWAVSVLGIVALGQTLLLISANFDMSVGYSVGLAGVVTVLAQLNGFSLVPSILIGLLIAAALGAFNGSVVVLTGASPFLITLGSGTLAFSIALALTQSKTLYTPIPEFTSIGQGQLGGGVYYSTLLFLGLAVALEFVLRRTTYGRTLFVLGTNETAGRLSGLRVARTKLITFVICGVLAGLAGLIVTSRNGSTVANVGVGYLFDSIIAAVLGGTSLFGGFGGTLRTVVGVMVLGVLGNLLILLNVPIEAQTIAKGIVFLTVVWADGVLRGARA